MHIHSAVFSWFPVIETQILSKSLHQKKFVKLFMFHLDLLTSLVIL